MLIFRPRGIEVREELRADFGERKIIWDVKPMPVQADLTLLRQVFVNLLSNAIKYTHDRPVARVGIYARRSGMEILVTVRDNVSSSLPDCRLSPRESASLQQASRDKVG